ncbi:hypothetical protein [Rhodococcoides fascians]|uniref:hypothetical protein n=1 Tax=Rhodococcoides fascians TaxID=1828 RepID=UPI00050CBAD9|nr:hypothetical protein [Rhodococcus fascians]
MVVLAENGKLTNPRPSTLAKFDTGLRWKQGSAAEVFWQGGSPIALGRSTYKPGSGNVSLGIDRVSKLLAVQQEAHEQFGHSGEFESNVESRRAFLRQLDDAVSLVAGVWVTDVLERNYGQDPRAINSTITDLLELPIDPDDPDYDEKLYRRWLFGKDTQPDPATVRRFRSRLNASRSR